MMKSGSISVLRNSIAFLRFLLCFAVFLFAIPSKAQNNIQDSLISQSFRGFVKAVADSNGRDAVQYIDPRTVRAYNQLYTFLLKADSIGVDTLPAFDKYTILLVRHLEAPSAIKAMKDGKGLFVYLVNRKLLAEELNTCKLEKIKMTDTSALIYNNIMPPPIEMKRSPYGWKVDLTSFTQYVNFWLDMGVQFQGKFQKKPVNYIILSRMQSVNGKWPSRNVWEPVRF